ncbi:hypothetical protein ACTM8Z_08380 [Atopobiaceae bacterium HCP3S3_D6]
MDDTSKDKDQAAAKADKSEKAAKADKADKDAKTDKDAKAASKRSSKRGGKGAGARLAVVAVVCLLVGGFVGYRFVGDATAPLSGKTTLSEGQLDTVLGTYTYKGEKHEVTAREAILETTTLDAAKNDDGTYNVPSVDNVLSIARNGIVAQDAADRGVTVSDDEVASYAQSTIGSSDYATIASTYGMDEDQVKSLMTSSATMKKLHDQIVTVSVPSVPDAPSSPASGQESTPTAEYASYIINLVGDEWDSNANTWARTDGQYYAALSSYTISNDSATYDAAQAAYYVAYSNYSSANSEATSQWTNYVNGLLSNATISLGTLMA